MYVRVICVLSGGGKDMEEVNILEKNPSGLVVAQNLHFFSVYLGTRIYVETGKLLSVPVHKSSPLPLEF